MFTMVRSIVQTIVIMFNVGKSKTGWSVFTRVTSNLPCKVYKNEAIIEKR